MTRLPAVAGDPVKALIHAIAMDIGKATVAYVQEMYPQVAKVVPPTTFWIGLRNHIHNEIMASIEVNDEGQIVARLNERKRFRRKMKRVRKLSAKVTPGDYATAAKVFAALAKP